MRRWLCTVLVSASACALEHSSVPWDTGVTAQDVQSPSDIVADDVPATDVPPPVDAAPDAADAATPADVADVADAGEEADVVDASLPDIVDAGSAVDVSDVPMSDTVDAGSALDVVDAAAPDIVDVVAAPDIIDVPAPRDVVDATAGPDVVDAGARPDVVVVDAPVDVPRSTFTMVNGDVQRTARQGNDNGVGVASDCNDGEALVGLSIQHSQYVNGLAARCAALRADGTLGSVRQTTYWGGLNGDRATDDCPAGSLAVGLVGRAGGIVDQLAVQCAPVAQWIPGRVVASTTTARGQSGGTPFTVQCPAGYVGSGVEFDTTLFDGALRVSRLRLTCVRVNRQP